VSKFERSSLCVHGHFSQPPRGNPLDGTIGLEPEAVPYDNWNERITEKSYRPNAEIGNFKHISFSFGVGLLAWLQAHAPETYALIVNSDQEAVQTTSGAGNALATAYNHSILPLARRRDKRTQITWGIAAFEYHFGRKPLGFWLPEMAVDLETLNLLADAGIAYTLLTAKQVQGKPDSGAGPYRVELPGGKSIGVFVRDDRLSSEISFNIHNLGGAGSWSHQVLGPARKNVGALLLLATAGETFGHHYAGEEQFLYWLVSHEALKAGYQPTSLDRYFLNNKPTQAVQVEERSSWGDQRGLTEWATGTVSEKRDTTWKGALRRALDNAASEIDRVYEELLLSNGVDPWMLREEYAPVIVGQASADAWMQDKLPKLKPEHRERLKLLLQAEELTQRMYNSYTFTDNHLDGRQPRYAIACAAAALSLAQQATGLDLNDRLPSDLAVVSSPSNKITGATILNEVVSAYSLSF
jgi:alpha-amylase/alpha-mannosidase (GH57 family)